MILNDKESVWAECEKLGETAVQAKIDAGEFGAHTALPRQWLSEKQEKRRLEKEAEDRRRSDRVLAAAEASARASEKAAEAAQRSAKWTMWAAVAALLSAIIPAIVQYLTRPA